MKQPTKVTAWQDSNGVLHPTIEGWQAAEMLRVLRETHGSGDVKDEVLATLAHDLIRTQAEPLLAILTMGPKSRPTTRKKAGTTNPKRATRQQRATPEQAATGFAAMRDVVNGEPTLATS